MSFSETTLITSETNTAKMQQGIYSASHLDLPLLQGKASIEKGYLFRPFRLTGTAPLFKFVIGTNLDNSSIKVLQW